MSELNPKNIVEDILTVSRDLLKEYGHIDAHLFLSQLGKPITVANMGALMENEDSKNVFAWIPVYYGLVNDGLDLVAMVTESWVLDSRNVEKYYDKERAQNYEFLQSLISQYGSISKMPKGFKKEIVVVQVEVSGQSYQFMWDIQRDNNGTPSLADDIVIDMTEAKGEVGGRFSGFLERYHLLSERMKEFNERNDVEEKITPADIAKINDKIQESQHHAMALSMSEMIVDSEKSANKERSHVFASPATKQ